MTGHPDRTPFATRVALVVVLAATAGALTILRVGPVDVGEPAAVAPFLWLFTLLFAVRVAGQVLVVVAAPAWLPPMGAWNLMPYRLLLPAQTVILAVMTWIDVTFSAADAEIARRPTLGVALLTLSTCYAGAMALRYTARMARRPEERWFGGAVPIVFHVVLASYLYVLGSVHAA